MNLSENSAKKRMFIPMNNSLEIRRITAAETRPLRQALLRQGVPQDQLVFPGDEDPDALHVGAFLAGEHVGIGSIFCQPPNMSVGVPSIHPAPDHPDAWRLRGMATTEAVRGQGIGGKILQACMGYVARQGGAFLWCDARIGAVRFYAGHGFETLGAQYLVPQVGAHYFMQRYVQPDDEALYTL